MCVCVLAVFNKKQDYKELCALNSVLYLKQFEIAIADSLGRVKIWDTRNKDQNRSATTLLLYVIIIFDVVFEIWNFDIFVFFLIEKEKVRRFNVWLIIRINSILLRAAISTDSYSYMMWEIRRSHSSCRMLTRNKVVLFSHSFIFQDNWVKLILF